MTDFSAPSKRLWFQQCARLLQDSNGHADPWSSLEASVATEFNKPFQAEVARFHVACAKAMHKNHRIGTEPSWETVESLVTGTRFTGGEARALCRELTGRHHDTILAHAVTPVLLVPGGEDFGMVMDLHLELIEEKSHPGQIHAAPVMLFVERMGDFDPAIERAVAWLKGKDFWPKDCDVRWRLERQFTDDPWPVGGIEGNSAGGAFLFGLLQLLAQAGRIPGSQRFRPLADLNRHPHSLRGVVWMCTVNAQGQLDEIGDEPAKFRGLREKSRPAIHTVLGARNQEKQIRTALDENGSVDGIQFLFENDPIEAAGLVVSRLDGVWTVIFDYRPDWSRHRDAMPRPWLDEIQDRHAASRAQGKAPGFLVLDAHSGFGKSASAARLFGPESGEAAGHFFRTDGGRDDAEKAIRSIVLQLCLIHRLVIPDLASGNLAHAAEQIFHRAGEIARRRGEIQWVVLDGLDRCADRLRLEALLPDEAPPGLSFFVTTHPWVPKGKLGTAPGRAAWMDLPTRETLETEIQDYLRGRRRDFDPPLTEAESAAIARSSCGLIGVARAITAHPSFSEWRGDLSKIPNGPGAWQGQIWGKNSPLQAIEDYRRALIERTGTMEPLGFQERLPIREAYVPMTTAPPVTSDTDEHGKPQPKTRERPPVEFREMFAHLKQHFPTLPPAVEVAGEPGSGKTTASAQLAWFLAQREAVSGLPPEMLPVWLRFQEMDDGKTEPPKSLEAFLEQRAEALIRRKGAGEALLNSRQPLLWILDGFDEIPSEIRQGEVARWIIEWVDSPNRRAKVDCLLLTSRPLGSEKWSRLGLNRLPTFELRPLDDDAQSKFIENYLGQFARLHPGQLNPSDVEDACTRLMEIVTEQEKHSSDEQRMARNPMMLSLICFLFASKRLPDDWDDLYERFVEEFFERGIQRLQRENASYGNWKPSEFQLPVALAILKRLAWSLQEQADRVSQPWDQVGDHGGFCLADEVEEAIGELKPRHRPAVPNDPLQFLRLMREHVGLMCWKGAEAGRMGFLHLNIQEWLAAAHCAAHNQAATLAQLFGAKPEDQREVVRLAMKMRKEVAENFHHDLFLGLLTPEVAADEKHDVFLSRLLEMAGVAG